MDVAYQRFEHVTLKIIHQATQHQPISAETDQLLSELSQSYEDLRKNIITFAFTAGCSKKIELIVHQLLRQLVQLAEKLSVKAPARKNSPTTEALHVASQKVEEALTFLETNFPQYLNMQENIPPGYKKLLQREMKIRLQELQLRLRQFDVSDPYCAIILSPAKELMDVKGRTQTTYHHAWYLKRMYSEMEFILRSIDLDQAESTINDFLIGINFNLPRFIKYMADQITLSLANANNSQEQIEILLLNQKRLAQLFQTCNQAYILSMAGARESLLGWVEYELKHIEKMQQMALIMPPQAEDFTRQPVLNSSLTVRELAAFFRIIVEKKILVPEHLEDLFYVVNKMVRTKGASVISAKSFGNNYYSVSPQTANTVKSLMLEMAKELRTFEQ